MRFVVKKEIFEELPSACFGVVMAKGIDNNNAYPEIEQFLDESIQAAMQRFEGRKVKEDPDILPYREAFRALNINPNKYFCSIEALFTRIVKGKGVPHINPVVDLGNAMMPGSKGHCATGGCAWYTKFGLISACFGWYWRLHLAPFLCMLTFQNQKRPFDPGIMPYP